MEKKQKCIPKMYPFCYRSVIKWLTGKSAMILVDYLNISIVMWGAIFCLITVISILIGRSYDRKGSRLLIALMTSSMLLMLSDALLQYFNGREGTAAHYIVRILAFSVFFFGFLIMPLVSQYLTHLIVSRSGIGGLMWQYVEWTIFILVATLLTLNLFTGFLYTVDQTNRYVSTMLSDLLPGVVGSFALIVSFGVLLKYLEYFNRFEKVAFITYLLLPLTALGVNYLLLNRSLPVLAIVISSLLLYYSYEFNSREYRIELEKNLADQQIRMFAHQIQPHFIFNSLSVIKHLSRRSPEEAVETIDEFADYLRSCSDMMNSVQCVPVMRELELVQHYINLQKKRFGDGLDYRTDFEDTDFEVPPFSVQTCVENAFTHGLRSRAAADGYISVRTRRSPFSHVIEIEDNGAGFDTRDLKKGGERHVGLRNTKERVELMCGGSFTVESAPEKGTRVTITVPESRKKHEDTDHG